MKMIHLSVLLLLVVYQIQATPMLGKPQLVVDPIAEKTECVDAKECPISDACHVCKEGYGPDCQIPTCIDGKCGVIQQCSQLLTTPPSETECKNDGECFHPQYCATECAEGTGPLCASARCVDGKCQGIAPCSQKTECKPDDLSQCIVPAICAYCKPGRSPGCAKASCENGRCKIISPCSIFTPESTTTIPDECQTDGQCAYVKQCVPKCEPGLQPLCASGACVKGRCVITPPCSQKSECTADDTSQCLVRKKCAKCTDGHSPGCTEVTCVDGKCKIIEPCTIFIPPSTESPPPITPIEPVCREDSECITRGFCLNECEPGYGPLCTTNKCVDGQCIVIGPCSQKIQCTPEDVSKCPVPNICARCLQGYSPPCSQAKCEDGQCKVIPPCSIFDEVSTTTMLQTTLKMTPKPTVCKNNSDCPVKRICAPSCRDGRTPLCATAECVRGKCVSILPCSQKTCETAVVCPVKRNNCLKCPTGYGPPCELATCECGICKIVQPCSKKFQLINSHLDLADE